MTTAFYANDSDFRKCSGCGELKPANDGRKWMRRQCPDCVVAYKAAYYAANRDKRRAYLAANREAVRAQNAARYAANRVAVRAYQKAYRQSEAGKQATRRSDRKRRAVKRNAICVHGVGCFDAAAAMMPARCATPGCRRRKDIQPDHIQPLAQGGLDCRHNLQPLCGHCNRRKQARLVDAAATGYLL